MERSEAPQEEKHASDHGLLLLILGGVLATYAITGFGIYVLIKAIA